MQRAHRRLHALKAQAEAGKILLLYNNDSEALTPAWRSGGRKKDADLRIQVSKAEQCILLEGDVLRRQLVVITLEYKSSADFLKLLDEVERDFRPFATNRPEIMVLDHDTTHISGISRQGLAERVD